MPVSKSGLSLPFGGIRFVGFKMKPQKENQENHTQKKNGVRTIMYEGKRQHQHSLYDSMNRIENREKVTNSRKLLSIMDQMCDNI